jgi:hypothetical protein
VVGKDVTGKVTWACNDSGGGREASAAQKGEQGQKDRRIEAERGKRKGCKSMIVESSAKPGEMKRGSGLPTLHVPICACPFQECVTDKRTDVSRVPPTQSTTSLSTFDRQQGGREGI